MKGSGSGATGAARVGGTTGSRTVRVVDVFVLAQIVKLDSDSTVVNLLRFYGAAAVAVIGAILWLTISLAVGAWCADRYIKRVGVETARTKATLVKRVVVPSVIAASAGMVVTGHGRLHGTAADMAFWLTFLAAIPAAFVWCVLTLTDKQFLAEYQLEDPYGSSRTAE